MIDLMLYHHECVDGSGYRGLKSEEMSLEIKLACICDAFDGWTIFRPHFDDRDTSPNAVIERMKTDKAGQFDTQLLLSFQEFMND
jgi:putative two-component system response regulator